MSYEIINDFRKGLDVRKFKLTAPTGTLKVANNGHITPGGEIEKRKAFARSEFSGTCFGLVATSTGLTTFGSAASPVGFPQTIHGVTLSYQRLQAPDGTTAMTGVVDAKMFGDKTFVVAQFGSNTYTFYDGSLVSDFLAGVIQSRWVKDITSVSRTSNVTTVTATAHGFIVGDVVGHSGIADTTFNGQFTVASVPTADTYTVANTGTNGTSTTGKASNNTAIAAAFVALVNESDDYTATVDTATNKADVSGLVGADFTGSVVTDSVNGSVTDISQVASSDAVAGVKAVGGFRIVAGVAGTGAKISSITVNGVAILSTDILFTGTTSDLAATVAAYINANSSIGTKAHIELLADFYSPSDGETITLGSKTYTFKTSVTSGNNVDGYVLIGASALETINNLVSAINLSGGVGYAANTTAHPEVIVNVTTGHFTVTAITAGSAGNSLAASTTSSHYQFAYPGVFSGGSDGTPYTALANGDTVTLYYPTATADANGYIIKVTSGFSTSANIGVCIGLCAISFNGSSIALTSLKADGVELMTGGTDLTFQDGGHSTETLEQFTARVAVSVNATSATNGFGAVAINNTLYVSKLVTSSFDNVVTIAATFTGTDGTVVDGVVSGALPVKTDRNSLGIAIGNSDTAVPRTSGVVTAIVTTGAGPFIYTWQEETAGSGNGIRIDTPTSISTTFSRTPTARNVFHVSAYRVEYPTVTGRFVCLVQAPDGTSGFSPVVKVTL